MKRIAVLLLAFVMLCSFVGCGGQEASSPSPSKPKPPVIIPNSSSSSSGENSSENSSSDSSSLDTESQDTENNKPQSIHHTHYCYSKLNDLQKGYYEKLYEAVNKMEASWIVLGVAEETYKFDIAVVRTALVYDHPEIFWLPSYYAMALGKSQDGEKTAMMYFTNEINGSPGYIMSRSEKEKKVRELDGEIAKMTSAVTAVDPYEIELELHDMLCQRTEYSDDKNDPMIYSVYGAIVNGKALCEGYSKAMQLLLSRFGITCLALTGVAKGEGHMWNAVLLDGEWYHLDATWNDTSGEEISHEYFNITDKQIVTHHTFSKEYIALTEKELTETQVSFNIGRPVCKGTINNFFARTGFTLTEDNTEDLLGYMTFLPGQTVEVGVSPELRDKLYSSAEQFLGELNLKLQRDYPQANFIVRSASFSGWVIRLYKTEV